MTHLKQQQSEQDYVKTYYKAGPRTKPNSVQFGMTATGSGDTWRPNPKEVRRL